MLRTCVCLLLVSAAALAARAAEGPLPAARKLWLRGKYAEAADLYPPAAGKDPAAAIGLARCLTAQGKDDEAVKVLTAFAKPQAVVAERDTGRGYSADVLAELAAIAFEHGARGGSPKQAERPCRPTAINCWPAGSWPNWTAWPASWTRRTAATPGWSITTTATT